MKIELRKWRNRALMGYSIIFLPNHFLFKISFALNKILNKIISIYLQIVASLTGVVIAAIRKVN
jgi:hypothetical protein